jgi:hypothetical protein
MRSLCPLCSSRKTKRYCPAQLAQICTVCCGTKREVVIDCPGDCVYLHAGREHERERTADTPLPHPLDPRLEDPGFIKQISPLVSVFNQVILVVREEFPEMLDADVGEALDSLIQTYQTKNRGIYYDFMPAAPLARNVFLALKEFIENPGRGQGEIVPSIKTDATLDCLQVLKTTLEVSYPPKPKSRAYLDDIQKFFGQLINEEQSSPLILP